jgi:hypothetical protein
MTIFGDWLAVALVLWTVSTTIAAILSAPLVWLGRRRVHWHSWEGLAFVLPFAVWCALSFLNVRVKTLSNLVEPILISLAIPVAAGLRLIVGRRHSGAFVASHLIALLCIVAAAVYFFMPALPE